VEVGIPNFMNLYATSDLGISATVAGALVGTYWFLMLVGRFAGGMIGAKFSSRAMITTVASLGIVLILLAVFLPRDIMVSMPVFREDISFGLFEVPIGVMFFVLCGLCTSVMWGGIFNMAVEGLGKYTSAASGIFMMMVCGGGILPLVQGVVADSAGYLTSYLVVLAGLAYILYYALFGSKNVNRDIPVGD
ncbi:MAG TPA: MFS transporter, partial [Alistipes sp.]|nr:MFS transporter [Alistipes sp.]